MKRIQLRDEARRSMERRDIARQRHQDALFVIHSQCLPYGSGSVSDADLNELDDATVELRAAKAALDRVTIDMLRELRR
jgi:hypothetical protein